MPPLSVKTLPIELTQDRSTHTLDFAMGVLRWEEAGCPRGLQQLEELVGNSTNDATYNGPVLFERVPGANLQSVVLSPSLDVLQSMIDSGNRLISRGAKAITTSCGFNAIFQKELSKALSVPVLTSSLIQIPIIRTMMGDDSQILVITANASALTPLHLKGVGVEDLTGIHIAGLEENREWRKIFETPQEDIDVNVFRDDLVELAKSLTNEHSIDAILLECTDLPPFAGEIRSATRLPVFDYVSLVRIAKNATAVNSLAPRI